MLNIDISGTNKELAPALQKKIDFKTKPTGALGLLEGLALQIGLIQQSLNPIISKPEIIVFAGDHGIVSAGVSPYPQDVTWQMVHNFVNGGAAINVFARQHGINIKVVDAGVNHDFPADLPIVHNKIGYGTHNFMEEPAMGYTQLQEATKKAEALVNGLYAEGCNCIGFGEMGIGNTTAAAAIMSKLTDLPATDCVGRGTGIDDTGLQRKIAIIDKTIAKYPKIQNEKEILATFGGFEIAMIYGAILQAAANKMIIMIDGFIATSALMLALKRAPNVIDYCVFCHQSDEKGHKAMLDHINAKPLLNIGLRLGEGTGCAMAFPIIQAAVNFLNEMSSFEDAGVSNK